MLDTDLQTELARSGRFEETMAIRVEAVEVNDYGEGEYEARFVYPRAFSTASEADFLLHLKKAVEDVLPRAWVVSFTVSSRAADAHEITVTFDYLPEGSMAAS